MEEFKQRKVLKVYHTIVKGSLPYNEGVIDAPIGRDPREGKRDGCNRGGIARRGHLPFQGAGKVREYTYLEVKLETGRDTPDPGSFILSGPPHPG